MPMMCMRTGPVKSFYRRLPWIVKFGAVFQVEVPSHKGKNMPLSYILRSIK